MARLAYRNRCEYFYFTSLRPSISPNLSWYFSASGLVSYRCSGSVISNRYVLTAAHCVTNLIDELDLWVFVLDLRFYRSFCIVSMWNVSLLSRRLYVRLGELDVHRNLCDNNHALCSEPQDFEIESIIHHEAYDSPKYSHDIALIRLRVATNSSKLLPSLLSSFFSLMHSLNISFRFHKSVVLAGWTVRARWSEFGRQNGNSCWLGGINITQCIRISVTAMASVANNGHTEMCTHLCEIQCKLQIAHHYYRKSIVCTRSNQSGCLSR